MWCVGGVAVWCGNLQILLPLQVRQLCFALPWIVAVSNQCSKKFVNLITWLQVASLEAGLSQLLPNVTQNQDIKEKKNHGDLVITSG